MVGLITTAIILSLAIGLPRAMAEHLFYSGSIRQAQEFCSRQWDDAQLRSACERNQQMAIRQLGHAPPEMEGGRDFEIIHAYCARQWVEDFSLRAACERNQIVALRTLKEPPPVRYEFREAVRGRCAAAWPEDFALRVACERNEAAKLR